MDLLQTLLGESRGCKEVVVGHYIKVGASVLLQGLRSATTGAYILALESTLNKTVLHH